MKPLFTIAAVSDLHVNKYSLGNDFFRHVNENADLLVVGGDIGDGKEEEIKLFLELVVNLKIPIVVIFGNHDCDSDNLEDLKKMLKKNSLLTVLDGECETYDLRGRKLGIFGIKGYGGGFSPHRVVRRGESVTKAFVDEEEREVLRLQMAVEEIEKIDCDFTIAVTHYAPFEELVHGEAKEFYILLGSSNIGDVLEKAKPDLCLSGHAHHGSAGIKKARGRIAACNIALKPNEGKISFFNCFQDGSVQHYYADSH